MDKNEKIVKIVMLVFVIIIVALTMAGIIRNFAEKACDNLFHDKKYYVTGPINPFKQTVYCGSGVHTQQIKINILEELR